MSDWLFQFSVSLVSYVVFSPVLYISVTVHCQFTVRNHVCCLLGMVWGYVLSIFMVFVNIKILVHCSFQSSYSFIHCLCPKCCLSNVSKVLCVLYVVSAQELYIFHVLCQLFLVLCLLSYIFCLVSFVLYLLSCVYCLLSYISCLVSIVVFCLCLLSCVTCFLSVELCLLSIVLSLLSCVFYLLSIVLSIILLLSCILSMFDCLFLMFDLSHPITTR